MAKFCYMLYPCSFQWCFICGKLGEFTCCNGIVYCSKTCQVRLHNRLWDDAFPVIFYGLTYLLICVFCSLPSLLCCHLGSSHLLLFFWVESYFFSLSFEILIWPTKWICGLMSAPPLPLYKWAVVFSIIKQ